MIVKTTRLGPALLGLAAVALAAPAWAQANRDAASFRSADAVGRGGSALFGPAVTPRDLLAGFRDPGGAVRIEPAAVPEAPSIVLFGGGLVGAVLVGIRRRRAQT